MRIDPSTNAISARAAGQPRNRLLVDDAAPLRDRPSGAGSSASHAVPVVAHNHQSYWAVTADHGGATFSHCAAPTTAVTDADECFGSVHVSRRELSEGASTNWRGVEVGDEIRLTDLDVGTLVRLSPSGLGRWAQQQP